MSRGTIVAQGRRKVRPVLHLVRIARATQFATVMDRTSGNACSSSDESRHDTACADIASLNLRRRCTMSAATAGAAVKHRNARAKAPLAADELRRINAWWRAC